MSSYRAFLPRKINYCPYMTHVIQQIRHLKIRSYDDMKRAVKDLCEENGGSQAYGIRVNNKERFMFFCYACLNIVTMSEARYDWTSSSEKDSRFESLQKRFFIGCIRHFCQKFCLLFHYFQFVYFDFVDFTVGSWKIFNLSYSF